jgi:type IV pilus assembly protein PilV
MTAHRQSGSVLIEALVAILIFSIGILSLVGLQAVSMKNTTQAKARVDASMVASQHLGQIWVDMANIANYAEGGTSVPSLPNGTRTTTIVGDQVTITVTWRMPNETDVNTYQTVARVNTNP